MKKFLEDFKKFAFKGNVIDMAVGVIVGGAFSAIVTSLINDLLMPLIGLITAGMDLKTLKHVIRAAVVDEAGTVVKPEIAVTWGAFIQNIIYFFLVALTLFFVVKIITRAREKAEAMLAAKEAARAAKEAEEAAAAEAAKASEPPAPPAPTTEELLAEIRDLLKNRQ